MKKVLSVFLAVSMIFMLAACSTTGNEAAIQSDVSSEAAQEATPAPTAAATAAPTAAPDANAPAKTMAVSETLNLLTGEETLSKEAAGKRPVAVMVNNATENLPQYGISDADLIFEVPVEGEVTRLMAMYGDYTKVPEVCSIRSCRYYYPILSTGFDAIYIHWGMDQTVAKRTLEELGTDNIDGNYGTYDLFDRDQSRLDEGYALEHTSWLDGPALAEAFKKNDVRLDLEKGKAAPAFNFNSKATASGTEDCTAFRVDFGANSGWGYYSDFSYDAETKTYLKTHNDQDHMDGKTEKQLAFTNVILMETEIGYLPNDNSGRREIDVTGDKKSGYYISEGKMEKITWSKKDAQDSLHFYDAAGKDLSINTGKTYIGICDKSAFRTDL